MAIMARKIYEFVKKVGKKDVNGNCLLKKADDHKNKKPIQKGFFPVYVGEEHKRYILPVACLSSKKFEELLNLYEEEIQAMQSLTLPCSTTVFEDVLNQVKIEKRL